MGEAVPSNKHGVQQLTDGAVRFYKGVSVIHGAGQIGLCERDPSERRIPQSASRSRLSAETKKESRSRIDEGMPESIQDNAGNVSSGIEPGGSEHLGHLFADSLLVNSVRRGEEFYSALMLLLGDGKSRPREINEEGQHSW